MSKPVFIAAACIAMCASGFAAEVNLKSRDIVFEPDPQARRIIVNPLYGPKTRLEPALSEVEPGSVITRVGGRVRDRHARESQFQAYQHYLPAYFENRTFGVEIDDTTPGGGNLITFRMTTEAPHTGSNFRAFFRGITTVAEYHHNATFAAVGNNEYTASITYNNAESRDIQAGDLIEFEVGVLLGPGVSGRTNYYSRAYLFRAGSTGIVPWQAGPVQQNSEPLPLPGRSGGDTTLSYNYSAEPEDYLIQMALNISGPNAQEFVEGRRLHHTRFDDGSHSEPGNPPLTATAGMLGPLYDARSCIACHERNGRNGDFSKHIVKLDRHPLWGNQLQSIAQAPVQAESTISISGYATTDGQFDDGTAYTLRQPIHAFSETAPATYSVRMPSPIIGVGLLEAVSETEIMKLADPADLDGDGISGRINSVTDPVDGSKRLGRFGWKAGAVSMRHQVARALAMDMGVTTQVIPSLDCGALQSDCQGADSTEPELDNAALEQMVKYVALLGVPPQRDLGDPDVIQGSQLFDDAGCAGCHAPTLTTGQYHPYAELRNQTIHPYTDLLLHDMGPGLADGIREGIAAGTEWRTAPLWGLGLSDVTATEPAYLHDGRAETVLDAILWHGGEAEASQLAVLGMTASERAALLAFLASL